MSSMAVSKQGKEKKKGKKKNDLNKHQVSTPEAEPMKDKEVAQDDSTKKGSPEKPRKKIKLYMKPIKEPEVDGESSCVKLLKFRKIDIAEIATPKVDQDFLPKSEDEKPKWWSRRKSYNFNIPKKPSKVVLLKIRRLSENETENAFVQVRNEKEVKPKTVTEFLTKTGFFLKKSYFAIEDLPCNRSLLHRRNGRRHLKTEKRLKKCRCNFCDLASPMSPKCTECRSLYVPESFKTENQKQIPFECKCKWCKMNPSVCSVCGRHKDD